MKKTTLLIVILAIVFSLGCVYFVVRGLSGGGNDNSGDSSYYKCSHENGSWEILSESECEKTGEKKYTCADCGEVKLEIIPALGHAYVSGVCTRCGVNETAGGECRHINLTDWIIDKAPSCTETGSKHKECTVCGAKTETESIAKTDHTVSNWVIEKEASCTENGSRYNYCTVCSEKLKNEIMPELGHKFVSGVCTRCGANEGGVSGKAYNRDGDYIYFGSYPQSQVRDADTLKALSDYTGVLPTNSNNQDWIDYGYYTENGNTTAFMWYKDVVYNSNNYRAVYFTSYRSIACGYPSSTDYSYQDDNGYNTSTVYWFKYEPIKWRILTMENGCAFLMSEIAIDSQQYYDNYEETRTIDGKTIYPNNYAESDIRSWLNKTFYNTAFDSLQQSIIKTTLVDNSESSTMPYKNPKKWNGGVNDYACENTNDNVFLLSYCEIENETYGFSLYSDDANRCLKSSDYAKSQGCGQNTTDSDYLGNCCWWLRSPSYEYEIFSCYIVENGYNRLSNFVSVTAYGVVPALWLKLDDEDVDECKHKNGLEWVIDKPATCSEEGIKHEECTICGARFEAVAIEKEAHTSSNWIIDKPSTCSESGERHKECTVCGARFDIYSIPNKDHTPSDWVVGQEPTCTENGNNYNYCTVCSAKLKYKITAALGHNYVSGVCNRCGSKKDDSVVESYTRDGDYIYFGSYPQNEVDDRKTINQLNDFAGTAPINDSNHSWFSYDYYVSTQNTIAYMWYKDVVYKGEKYRGVCFNHYRPSYCRESASMDNTYQDDNGYKTRRVYWFRYQPIRWRILSEANGGAFLMSEIAIDSQQYYHNSQFNKKNGKIFNPNNYAESEIREWLNQTFYNTAFTVLQQALIKITLVDNSAASTNSHGVNDYACEDTNDKIFLLSYKDVTNSAYGFAAGRNEYDRKRQLKSSDYAKSQGCYHEKTFSRYAYNCWWLLRSPVDLLESNAVAVDYDGRANLGALVSNTSGGVVPALWLNL